ncbi:MAG: glycosyltransferase [bacterium]
MRTIPEFIRQTHPRLLTVLENAPELQREVSRNGEPTVRFGERFVHSQVDPRAEARRLAEHWLATEGLYLPRRLSEGRRVPVIFLGVGLGYPVLEFCAMLRQRGLDLELLELYVFESFPELLKAGFKTLDWSVAPHCLRLFVGNEGKSELLQLCQNLNAPLVFSSPGITALAPAFYDEVRRNILQESVSQRPLRILVPIPIYGGSVPTARYCARALQSLGHRVETVDGTLYHFALESIKSITRKKPHRNILQGMLTAFLAETIVARALDWKADFVLALAQTPLTPQALQELRREGIPSAMWFVEDYHLFTYWKELAPFYDHFFAIQKDDFGRELLQIGQRNFHYLPAAACRHLHRPTELTGEEQLRYGSDLSFVGAGYYNRVQSFRRLLNYDFKIWGNDWPEDGPLVPKNQEKARRVDPEESVKIFSASKINLNLHSSPTHAGVDPFGDFVNPRTFEIAACGAFQLVDERKYLPELFDPSSEIALFQSVDELPAKIDYFLAHPQERADMARRARERVLREHTYEHRMKELVEVIEASSPQLGKRQSNHPAELVRRAGPDTDLGQFFGQFLEEDEELTLDRIAEHIRKGKGELTDVEGTFLLMKEFRDWAVEKGVID